MPPPASSRFRVKGIVYLGTKAFFDTQGPDAYARLVAAITDAQLQAFFTQPFLSGSWYDVLPVARLIEIEAKVLGLSLTDYLRRRTIFQADRDIGGVYRFLLKLASPQLLAPRLASLLSQVFDFGTASVVQVDNRHYRYRFGGWPTELSTWYTTAFDIYARRAMALAGAANLQLTMMPPTVDGIKDGVEIGTLIAEVRF